MFVGLLFRWLAHKRNIAKYKNTNTPESVFSKFFLNRYTALVYAVTAWHCVGYTILSTAKKSAGIEGNFFIHSCLDLLILTLPTLYQIKNLRSYFRYIFNFKGADSDFS